MASGAPTWRGPDGTPRRTHPLTVAAALVPMILGLLLFVISSTITATTSSRGVNASRSAGTPWFAYLGAVALVVTGVSQVLRWAFSTYTVLPTELVIDEGVLSREHRVLPYARVQQADTHQSLVGQILGLTELRVDSAGVSGTTQVKLRLLDDATARALRDYVLQRRSELQGAAAAGASAARPPAATTSAPVPGPAPGSRSTTPPPPGAPEQPVLHLGPGRLALAAITHSSLVVGVPVIAGVLLWTAAFAATNASTRTAGLATLGLVPIAVLLVAFLVFAQLVQSVIGLYGFTISLAGDDIHLRYGLFETRNLTVPRRRVQQITIADNPLRRSLGLVELSLHTAAAPGAAAGATTRFLVPVLRRDEVDGLVARLMGTPAWAVPRLTPRPDVARRRAVVRRVLALVVVVAVPALLLAPAGLLLFLLVLLGVSWGFAAHRRAGDGESTTVVAVSHGVLHHRIDLVPLERVQSCRTAANPFQRASGVATFTLDVAGSRVPPFLWDMDADRANDLRRRVPLASRPGSAGR